MNNITCPHCGNTYPDFDVAHVCSKGPYAPKFDPEQAVRDFAIEQEKKAVKLKELLDKADFLDDDGYPTDDALETIRLWHWNDQRGWFNFIKGLWYMASWGWSEGEEDHDWDKLKKVYRYNISTAGWSGNETIIRAMRACDMMWDLTWVQSRRGGHYIFEIHQFGDDNESI